MAKSCLLVLVILCIVNFSNAQIRTTTLSQSHLLEIQKLPLTEIRSYLTGLGWKVSKDQKNLLKSYFNYSMGFKADKWQPDLKNQWEGTLYVFYKENFPNLIIYQTTKTIFNNIKPTYLQPLKEQNVEISILTRYGLAMEFRNYLYEKTLKKYSILCYDIESIKNLLYSEKQKAEVEKKEQKTNATLTPTKDKRQKATQDKTGILNTNLALGNEFYKQGLFDKALNHYRLAKRDIDQSDEKSQADLESRIQNCLRKLEAQDIQLLKDNADELFTLQKYKESLQAYEKISQLDPDDQNVKERIKCIRQVMSNELANTNHIYRKIYPEGYSRFNDINVRALNFMMRNAGDHGIVEYTFNVKFDGKGSNLSSFKVNSLSDERLMFSLTDITVNAIPVSEVFIPCINRIQQVASTDILNYKLKWESRTIKALVKDEITFMETVSSEVRDTLKSYIQKLPSPKGVYTFKITNKNFNDHLYQDAWLTSFKNKSFKASNFVPGFATYSSSGGKKGKVTMIAFLLSTAIAIGSKIYSDHQFDQYKNPSNIADRDQYYNRANFANKCFVVSGGFAAGIYLHDISSFIIRNTGAKNNKNRALKNELKNGPVTVMENSINP